LVIPFRANHQPWHRFCTAPRFSFAAAEAAAAVNLVARFSEAQQRLDALNKPAPGLATLLPVVVVVVTPLPKKLSSSPTCFPPFRTRASYCKPEIGRFFPAL
jgi:hypothetical protein